VLRTLHVHLRVFLCYLAVRVFIHHLTEQLVGSAL